MTGQTTQAVTPPDSGKGGGHPLADDVNWLMHRAALGIGRFRARALTDLGLTVREAVLLAVLSRTEGQTQSELASLIKLDKSVFTTTIEALAAKGLVERRPDPKDRRIRRPELTAAGRARNGEAEEAFAAAQAEALSVLPPATRSALVELLQTLVFGPFADEISIESPATRL